MSAPNLERLFNPASVAVVGASSHEAGIGNRVLTLLAQHAYPGKVYAVNPNADSIGDIPCFPDVALIPETVDLVIIAVKREAVIDVVRACASSSVGACIIMSAGLGEGGAGATEVAQIKEILRGSSLRVMGPNSLGIYSPITHLAATFSTTVDSRKDMHQRLDGSVAILSQSGALAFSAGQSFAWAGVGIGAVVCPGNSIDLDVVDFAEYLLARPEIGFVATVIEEIKDAEKLRALGDAVRASGKPVAVLKLGRSEAGQRASLSHTGSMAGSAEVYSGFLRQYGMLEAFDTSELLAFGKLFANPGRRYGRRIGIVTPSGGSGIMITDLLESYGLIQPETSPELAGRLAEMLPPHSSVVNPVDVTAQATANADRSGQWHAQEAALEEMVDSGEFDIVITHLPLGARNVPRLEDIARIGAAASTVVVVYSDRALDEISVGALRASGLPWFSEANLMMRTLAAAAEWTERDQLDAESVEVAAPALASEHTATRSPHFDVVQSALERSGIGSTPELQARTPSEVAARADELGYPVVVKLDARDVPHKTELDGVRVNITDASSAARAAEEILQSAVGAGYGDVGLVVQRMAKGVEALVSYRRDSKFGPVIVLGCGGTQTELLRQFAVRLAPVSHSEARGMIREVGMLDTMLRGFRGQPPADRGALCDYLVTFSQLAASEWTEVSEVEVNPLIVQAGTAGVVAVDLLVNSEPNTHDHPIERQGS